MMNDRDMITAVFLQQHLSPKFPGVEVQNLQVERIGEGFGLASQIVRCRWQTGALPRSVVVKRWPLNTKVGRQEILFYRTFAERVGA
ncbi:MAG: hypothetical protein KC419_24880, partial [Anaerolineales bacterium]|nr:hypothetical protein [Anaerolineales bacterium]